MTDKQKNVMESLERSMREFVNLKDPGKIFVSGYMTKTIEYNASNENKTKSA